MTLSMNTKTRNLLLTLSALLLIGASVGGYTLYNMYFTPAFAISEPTRIYIDNDDDIDSVRHKVESHLAPHKITAFDWLADYYHYADDINTGCFTFSPSDNMLTAVRRLSGGWQTPVRLVVPSVRTLDRMTQALAKQLMIGEKELLTLLADTAYIHRMGYNSYTLPALFVPNTYEVYWNISAEKLLARLQKEHDRFWNEERKAKAKTLGLTPEQVVTLASIVDEETAVNAEKPMVAGLYLNRLRRGMLLQADPTVKFAMQDFTLRRILNEHLKTDSPYNTYLYAGLPPGPIRIPTVKGIESVLSPAEHNYLYMCAKEDFSGTHNFASTLSQHNANARRYRQALDKRGIR